MDYTQLLLTILVVVVVGLGGGGLLYLFKSNKLPQEETKQKIYTLDQVLSILYVIAKAVSEKEEVVNTVYFMLDGLVEYAKALVEENKLDRQKLLNTAYGQCAILGIEVTKEIKTAVDSGVELIYIFVSE